MNNKTKTYLLLAAVLGIWGTVGYKIINGVGSDDDALPQEDIVGKFKPRQAISSETFDINPVERDPFLGTLASAKKPKTTTRPSVTKAPEVVGPTLRYIGLVKDQQSNNQIFVVSIDNTQHLMKKGQEINSVKLIRGDAKKIIVRVNGKTQTLELE